MIVKTEGIVLRVSPYSETSLVTAWMTRDAGKVTTLCKGALRPKSAVLGQFDLFYTCELLYYERADGGLHILRECAPIKLRSPFRGDWRACAAASYLADLLFRVSPSRAHHPGIFEWMDEALDDLALNGVTPACLFWLELRLLSLLGFTPRLRRCALCGCTLKAGMRGVAFDAGHGGAICPACVKNTPGERIDLPPDIWAALSAWQRAASSRAARRTRVSTRQEQQVEKMLLRFLQYHLETPLKSRGLALDAMRRGQQGKSNGFPVRA